MFYIIQCACTILADKRYMYVSVCMHKVLHLPEKQETCVKGMPKACETHAHVKRMHMCRQCAVSQLCRKLKQRTVELFYKWLHRYIHVHSHAVTLHAHVWNTCSYLLMTGTGYCMFDRYCTCRACTWHCMCIHTVCAIKKVTRMSRQSRLCSGTEVNEVDFCALCRKICECVCLVWSSV
jgi:hypothetical protein